MRTIATLAPCCCFTLSLLIVGSAAAQTPPRQPIAEVRANAAMVVSDSPVASRAGRDVLAAGGNAVDAAVATAFALAVTWPEAGNLGGGGFMMIHPADGNPPMCVDYREVAPLAATETMFAPNESRDDCKSAGVPGTVRGLALAHAKYGKLPWGDVVMPAITLARTGFPADEWLAHSTNGVLRSDTVKNGARHAELRRVYGHPEGRPWKAGDTMVLPDLARTLQKIVDEGADGFYRGPVADLMVAEMKRGDGLISHKDLAEYEAKLREPIRGTYRGYDLYGSPPPSSGGICVIETLNILEEFELREHPRFGARNLHLIAEAMRRAFCDRARYLGDPDFTDIPPHLTTKAYARKLAGQISLDHATRSEMLAPEIDLAPEGSDTTHFSVIDAQGMAVSNTYTLESSWGSRIVVQGAGFVLNNEMGDFNWVPGHTDRSGRIGTAANLIRPRKRMLSSQAPFIAARDGNVVLLTGSPGGRTIINTVIGNLLNVLEFDMPLQEAIDAPRIHHPWFPDALQLETALRDEYAATVSELESRGHRVTYRPRQGSAHSIQVDRERGEFVGVADWRRGGLAAGYSLPAQKPAP